MAPRFAYWLKTQAYESSSFVVPPRIRAGWPNDTADPKQSWMVQRHPSGVGALLVYPRLDGAAVTLDAFGEPRETVDGMTYYPSLEKPTAEFLIRTEKTLPPGEWVKTVLGELYIGVAYAAPRSLVLLAKGGASGGKHVTEFGRLAHELFDDWTSKDGCPAGDPRPFRVLFLGLRSSYEITEEVGEDLNWLTSADIVPCIDTILGCNPKPSAAEPAGSPSSAPTIPASP